MYLLLTPEYKDHMENIKFVVQILMLNCCKTCTIFIHSTVESVPHCRSNFIAKANDRKLIGSDEKNFKVSP